jgi:WD40 repeat protein
MRRWFLSYHSPDEALAKRLKAAIQQKDEGAHVFFAPANLRAGGRWAPALSEAIAEATAFVLLVTDKGIGRWQEIEYDAAFDRHVNTPDFPVVLMLLEGQTAPRLSFLKQLHWIVTRNPASEKDVARLIDAVRSGSDVKPGKLWRYTSPYRGLSAMEEKDSDYFFGRERETVEVLSAVAAESGRLPVLLGNSGVGKSSLAQAGVIAALRRQAWPERMTSARMWPARFKDSRGWCFLTLKPGSEPIKALVDTFLRTWQYDATDSEWEERQKGWVDRLSDGRATLCGLLDATERRYEQIGQPKPRTVVLYVDQGEELYVRGEHQRRRFSELLAQAIADPRLVALMSMRSDFLGHLQNDEPLFAVHRKIDVPPLREAELSRVIQEPAQQLSARFESEELVAVITRRTLEDSVKDVGALPLLSYTLDDMWTEMVRRDDGVLRLPAGAFELGGVLAERANAFLARNPNSEGALRRVLTIRLATVRKEGDPSRRRARRSEFSDDEWRLVSELAGHPNRLLVTATPEGHETYAEVAHEAIFRRWQKLLDWITLEREFLAWKTTLDDDRRRWEEAPEASKNDALLLGLALAQAQGWLVQRAEDMSRADREFIDLSRQAESDRREASRQLEIQRVKAEEEVARLSAEKEAQEHRERAAREEVARLRAEKEAQEQKERAGREELARLQAEQEARDQRHRASEEELARLRAENEARTQRERVDSIVKRRKTLAAATVVILAVAGVAALNQWNNYQEQQRRLALELTWLATVAARGNEVLKHEDPNLALLLALEFLGTKKVYGDPIEALAYKALLTPRPKAVLSARAAFPTATFSPDGQLLLISKGNAFQVWKANEIELVVKEFRPQGVSAGRRAVWSADGRWIIGATDDNRTALFAPCSVPALRKYFQQCVNKNEDEVWTIGEKGTTSWPSTLSPTGDRLLTGGSGRDPQLWDIGSNPAKSTFRFLDGPANSAIAFNQQGDRLALGSTDGSVRIHETADPTKGFTLRPQTRCDASGENPSVQVFSVAFNPGKDKGDEMVSTTLDGCLRLWNVKEQRLIADHNLNTTGFFSASFDPSGQRIAMTSDDGSVRIWEPGNPDKPDLILRGHRSATWTVEFSRETGLLASASSESVRIWPLAPALHPSTLPAAPDLFGAVRSFELQGGALTLRAGNWRDVTLDVSSSVQNVVVAAAAVSKDGNHVLVAEKEKTLKLYDLSVSQAPVAKFEIRDVEWKAVGFLSEPDRMVGETTKGEFFAWPFFKDRDALIEFAEKSLPVDQNLKTIELSQVDKCRFGVDTKSPPCPEN